jgi:hypothetical protein
MTGCQRNTNVDETRYCKDAAVSTSMTGAVARLNEGKQQLDQSYIPVLMQ